MGTDFDSLTRTLKLEDFRDALKEAWGDSEDKVESSAFYLSEEYLAENFKLAHLCDEDAARLRRAAEKIKSDKSLMRLFAHERHLLFEHPSPPPETGANFSDMRAAMGEDGPAFNALLAISGFPKGWEHFNGLGLPREVALGTFKDISLWMAHFKQTLGFVGITPRILGWERAILNGVLYRVGRLQYGIRPFHGKLTVFKNRLNGGVLALAADGCVFNQDGQFDGVDDVFCKEPWTSTLSKNGDMLTGNPLSPYGRAVREPVTIDLREWEEKLTTNDPVIDIHIPSDGPMRMEDCAASIAQSADFFTKHFPDKPFKGWGCHSWFLDIQYRSILPETSNIIKFQNEFHLFPSQSGEREAMWRIFGEKIFEDGLDKTPLTTSMQKAVAQFIRDGGRLRSGGAFFLKEDLPWGGNRYQR